MFTGLPVSAHGCTWDGQQLDLRFDTLPELLRADGYQTAAFCSNQIMRFGSQLHQGFQKWWIPSDDPIVHYRPTAPADRLVERIAPMRIYPLAEAMHQELAKWFEEKYRPDRPFFVFLNYIGAHLPYDPPSRRLRWADKALRTKWRERFDWNAITNYNLGFPALTEAEAGEFALLYDEEIAYVDGKVGEILDWLAERGLFDSTLIIITSDHGEHLGERHLLDHEFSLYEPIVRVPLIIRYPGVFDSGVRDGLVQTHDLFPTVLEVAGVSWTPSDAHNCRSLVGMADDPDRMAVAEYLAPWRGGAGANGPLQTVPTPDRFLQAQRAVQVGPMKLIAWEKGDRELYNLVQDPLEAHDLAGQSQAQVASLWGRLTAWLDSFAHYAPAGEGARAQPSADDLEALKALGYVR